MRILVVTDQYAPMVGGVPTVTRELAHGLADRGHAVALVAPSTTRAGGKDDDGRVSITYRGAVRWPWYDGMRLGFLPPAAARALIASFAPDVVHLHSPVTLGVVARRAARKQRVPTVYTNHYLPVNVCPTVRASTARDALFYRYVVGFANRCDHATAPTATALKLLRERGLRVPSDAISNGVDRGTYAPRPATGRPDRELRARYAPGPGDGPLILSVGRLSPEKRVDLLLAAAARIATPGATLLIAGTGPDESRLRARARRSTCQVRFLGHVPDADLPGLYRLADVFALASEAELQSLATMEAMASGLPVVAADARALGELVRHGENGFLAAPGNSADLAARLDAICGDPALRAAMSAASLRLIAGHDKHRILVRWESLYRAMATR